ncbi:hypothetical protein M1293_03465 [Candidatus Parvarchaeota archaeon]|nr:hypothetical protein [Candidatus Parvarchaeota archaeon]
MQIENPQDRLETERRRQLEKLKQEILIKYLTKEARERLGNLRYAHPDMAESVENMIVESALSNRLKSMIDDDKLKALLQTMSAPKNEHKINFKEKDYGEE